MNEHEHVYDEETPTPWWAWACIIPLFAAATLGLGVAVDFVMDWFNLCLGACQ